MLDLHTLKKINYLIIKSLMRIHFAKAGPSVGLRLKFSFKNQSLLFLLSFIVRAVCGDT